MRTRKIIVGLALGATAGLGLMAAPAQAASAAPPAASASAGSLALSRTASTAFTPTAAAGWQYVDWFLTQANCRAYGSGLGIEGYNWYCAKSGVLWNLYYWPRA